MVGVNRSGPGVPQPSPEDPQKRRKSATEKHCDDLHKQLEAERRKLEAAAQQLRDRLATVTACNQRWDDARAAFERASADLKNACDKLAHALPDIGKAWDDAHAAGVDDPLPGPLDDASKIDFNAMSIAFERRTRATDLLSRLAADAFALGPKVDVAAKNLETATQAAFDALAKYIQADRTWKKRSDAYNAALNHYKTDCGGPA